jgi:hypothetical protein
MLFEIKESLSPKEAWCRRFRILTVHTAPGEYDTKGHPITESRQWLAVRPNPQNPAETIRGEGATEHEALAALALKIGVPMWNEEGYVAFTPSTPTINRTDEVQCLLALEGRVA